MGFDSDGDISTGRNAGPAPQGGKSAWPSLIAAAIALLTLTGCQNIVAQSSVYYNDGLATAFNRLLLANVIRSAKGQPTYYSAIGDYSAGVSGTSSPGLSVDFSVDALDEASVSASLGPSTSRDRNANVSSLETKDFTQAMRTPISSNLAVFIYRGRDGLHLDLAIALTVKGIALPAKEYEELAVEAIKICNTRFDSLSSAQRGVCKNFSTVLAEAACGGNNVTLDNTILVLHNDPTNACEYARFRLLAESLAVIRPRLSTDEDGNTVFSLGIGESTQRLFGAKGSGFVLRSPNEMVQYLGEIVRIRFEEGRAATPKLTSRDGKSIPIFAVKSGSGARHASDSVKIDGKFYALPDQGLGDDANDHSYRSLAIIKDLLTLNTSDDQLPSTPAIILGRPTR